MSGFTGASRRLMLAIVAALAIIVFLYTFSMQSQKVAGGPTSSLLKDLGVDAQNGQLKSGILDGHAIAPKLGNETAKAELGRAAWKLFHTTFARFPDKPTADEQTALESYIHLFQRLYPCGECAEHFGQILKKYPPQVSTRTTAATWGCHVHNEVNKSLKKDIFDCSNIGDFYDCGCADDETDDAKGGKKTAAVDTPPEKPEMDAAAKERLTSTNGRDINVDLLAGDTDLKLEKEGLQKGG